MAAAQQLLFQHPYVFFNLPDDSLTRTSPSIQLVENPDSSSISKQTIKGSFSKKDSYTTTASICGLSTRFQDDILRPQEAIDFSSTLRCTDSNEDMNGEEEGLEGANHRDKAANARSITSRIAEAGDVNATSARSASGALPDSSSSGNMEAPRAFPRVETSRCAFHPSRSALFHRPARRDGSRSRSDSLVVHAESEEEDRYVAGPLFRLAQQELAAQQTLPPPSASMNTTTSGSSNSQPHPKFAQIPGGLRDKPRPPQTRHRRFAKQLKRKLRELESTTQPNGDRRMELAPKAPPSLLHHASNQAYDADTEGEGEPFPAAARSSLNNGHAQTTSITAETNGGVTTKRYRPSALSQRVDSLMPDVASKNSETL